MSTKLENIENPESCLNRAERDEPIFVLRAHDPDAPLVVRQWASLYAARKTGLGRMMTPQEHKKYNDALDCANNMENWLRLQAWNKQHSAP